MLTTFLTDICWLPVSDFPGRVIRGRFSLTAYHDALWQQAALPFPDHLSAAVAKRRAEYLAGRLLARQALEALGHPQQVVARGADRAPVWPVGIAGALSHNADTALCAVAPATRGGGVGLDVETQMPAQRAEQLWSGIVNPAEQAWLRQQPLPFSLALTLTFSAKESLFKALYPQVRRYFDFLDAHIVALDPQAQTFTLALLQDLTPQCPAGRRFNGRFMLDGDNVTTFIFF
ncbi:4'-phosphopantetheinyl transferase family protein [Serratia rubidaea]|uniref:Enterobactin synthase component D n=1 Tax=Serratia rubidaea TaxID=61652 RepID=A0A448SKM0_SERRU|nr:4'-phosphopantetheinyl transferase superfamily protein [Serratia rubidaea]MBH1929630.1 4'-phosphopantetheinyl transferase superfamily protein [Serratia rubidaea]MDC6118383.1 4'-phosphopantetheinyl transferase superfamily protein [Serratia rubidaea]MEB7585225.1 4'-phosphopantetheinyl transferase superfamily protein [Serratia rubidaea]VEI68288.1 phosphopantetheinyltransferase component of enterobactin synthase multienzyme complex [Serratia rubidaea]